MKSPYTQFTWKENLSQWENTACEAFHSIIMLFLKGLDLEQMMSFGYVEDHRELGDLACE